MILTMTMLLKHVDLFIYVFFIEIMVALIVARTKIRLDQSGGLVTS